MDFDVFLIGLILFNTVYRVLQNIQQMVVRNEELKQEELKYKEQCREEIARLEQEIR